MREAAGDVFKDRFEVLLLGTRQRDFFVVLEGVEDALVPDLAAIVVAQLVAEVRQKRLGVHLIMGHQIAALAEFLCSDVGLRTREEDPLGGRERSLQREENVPLSRSRRFDFEAAERANHLMDLVDPNEVELDRWRDFPQRVDTDDELLTFSQSSTRLHSKKPWSFRRL